MASRRRGKELEDAILQAAWSLFTRDGFTAVTMQQVAADAGTSKPVLYRRWPDRNALLKDAIAFGLHALSPATPNTGFVRGDLVAFMTDINRTLVDITTAISIHLAARFDETGATPSDVQPGMPDEILRPLHELLDRAAERGEIDRTRLTPRLISLPLDLMRVEIVTTMRPLSPESIAEIVDTVFLPLVTSSPVKPL